MDSGRARIRSAESIDLHDLNIGSQQVPLRLSRRVRFGVGELTSYLDAGIGGTHQWFVEDNRHQVIPTVHLRSGVGTTA